MTNKQDQQMVEDQAFIDSLYQEVAEDNASQTEQPSEQLDQRILAAAHKAVASQPMPATIKQQKKKSWFFPLATAASFLLMITVINHQFSSPIIGNEAQPVTSQLLSSDSFNEETVSSMSDSIEMDQALMEKEFTNIAQPMAEMKASRMAEASKMKSTSLAKKSMQRAKQSTPMAEEIEVEQVMSSQVEMASPNTPELLTDSKYLQLKNASQQQMITWKLLAEDKTSFIIKLQLSNQTDTLYRLNKNNFDLNENIPPEKNEFPQIKRIHKNQ